MKRQVIAIAIFFLAAVLLALVYGWVKRDEQKKLELLNEDIGQPRAEKMLIQNDTQY